MTIGMAALSHPLILLLIYVYNASTNTVPGELGAPCLTTREPCLMKNSDCIDGICSCSNLSTLINGSCIAKTESSSLGQPCQSGSDCPAPGEFCSSYSICMCLSTHVDIGTSCEPAVYPGQYGCEDSRQCNKGFPGAECDSTKKCICPYGMEAVQQTCIISSVATDLVFGDQYDRPQYNQRIRQSPSSYRRYYNAPSTSLALAPDVVCSADADCAGYPLAYCEGVCRCVQGALNAGSTCISSGSAVQPAGSCPPGQTYVIETGSCMTVQQPGDPCQYSQQCAAAETGAFCLRLRCECVYGMRQSGTGCTFVDTHCTKRGTIYISELGECREVLPPGGRGCSHSLQCTAAYADATCFLQTCTCPPAFPMAIDGTCGRNCSAGETYSGVTGQCLPTVQPGDQCLYSSQCHAIYPGMVCERNRCRCPNGMVFSGTKCTQTCPTSYIVNSKGICMPGCRSNQVEYEGECLDQASPGSPCVVNAQCTGEASCQNSICTCPRAMIPRGNICVYAEAAPLESCRDGQVCTGGSFCSNGNCTCPVGRQIVNGQCVTPVTVNPNSPCNPSVTCGGGSTCIGNVCQCPANQQIIDNTCQVPRSVQPGSPCPTGLERCLGQSSCIGGVCQCPFGTYPSQNECLPIKSASAGSPCNANIRCQGLSVCVDGTCACPSGLTIIEGECRAATQVSPGSSCANGEVCAGGSYCSNKICICSQNTQAVDGVCQQVVTVGPGQSCSASESCGGGSNCDKGTCVCPLGTVNFQGTCKPLGSSLGQCDSQQQCSGGAYCDVLRNQCTCPENTVVVGSLCISNQYLSPTDSSCTFDADCYGERVCVMKKCQCMFGELADGSCRNLWLNRRFMRNPPQKISLDESTDEDPVTMEKSDNNLTNNVPIGGNCLRVGVTCEGGSVCTSGHCLCPPGLSPVNNRCVQHRTAHPGEPCGNGEDCTGESQCNMMTRRCECIRESQMVIGKTCQERLRSHPGYPCSNNEICVGGSTCRQGRCACADNEISINKLCVKKPIVNPGDSCENGEDCSGDSECDYSQKRCVCRGGLEIVDGRCRMVSMISPGDSCSSNLVRCGGGSFCSQGRCECNTNYVAVNGKCTRQKHVSPGNACTAIDICTGKAQCRNGICHCPIGLVSRGGICEVKQKVLPMEPCLPGDECLGGSKCNGMICECAPGQVRRDDKCQERLRRKPGETCDPEDLCIGLSYCSKNVCKCKPNERIKDEKCVKKRQVPAGSKCSSDDICLGVSTCIDGICACPSGKALVGEQCKEIRTVALGRSCDDANVCASGSICDSSSKICKCPEGMQNSSGRCIKVVERPKPSIVSSLSLKTTTLQSTTLRPSTTASPSARCVDNSECDEGLVCSNGYCVCPLNMKMKNRKCVPKSLSFYSLLKEPCSKDDDCIVPHSYCLPLGICGCESGYRIQFLNRCQSLSMRMIPTTRSPMIPRKNVLSAPTSTDQESVIPSTIEETINTLASLMLLKPKPDDVDYRYVFPGDECNEHRICFMGSVCVTGTCQCPAGTILTNRLCIRQKNYKIAPPTGSCASGELCSQNSQCRNGICTCIEGYTLFKGTCHTLQEIHSMQTEKESFLTSTSIYLVKNSKTTAPSSITSTTTKTTVPTPSTTSTTQAPITSTENDVQTSKVPKLLTSAAHTYIIEPIDIPSTPTSTESPLFWFKIAKPGHACDEETRCINCAICVQGVCQCPEGLQLHDEQCLSPVDARSCLSSNQCPSGAECFSGECRCLPGLAPSRFGFCIPITYADPGMACRDGEQCRGGSVCKEGLCVCNEGLFINGNKCLPPVRAKRKVLEPNPKKKQFSSYVTDLDFQQKMSEAEKNMLRATTSTRLPLGDRCSTVSICGNGGSCTNGICKCPVGMVQASNTCLLKSTISSVITNPGGNCQSGYFCDGGASCVNYICQCPSGYNVVNNVCSPVLANAMESCSRGERCSHGSLCIGGTCVCPKGFIVIEGNCVSAGSGSVAKSPGISCLNNPNICTGGSYCIQGVCTCPFGTENMSGFCLPSNTGTLSYASPGGVCVDGQIICTGNSVCANGFCVCPGGEQIKNDVCVSVDSQSDPGQMCELGLTVCTGNSNCIDGVCRCPEGQTSLNGQCALVSTVTTTMSPSCLPRCPLNSYCFNGRCYCNQGFNLVNGECVRSTCSSPCYPNSNCQQGNCVCNTGYIQNGNQCLPNYNPGEEVGLPGQACDTRPGALLCTNRALCVNSRCICPTNLILYGQTCVDYAGDAYPGQSCATAGIICRGGSSCSEGTCKCSLGFYPNNQICLPFVFTFVPNPVTTAMPYPFELKPGAACDPRCEYQPCLQRCGSGSQCINGYCSCPVGTYEFGGTCIPSAIDPITTPLTTTSSYRTARPGDKCDVSILCTGGSTCLLGTCTCDEGYTPSFDRSSCMLINMPLTQRSYPGGNCSTDSDCVGNSFCTSKVCSCLSGEVISDRTCVRRRQSQITFPGSPCTSLATCQAGSHCVREYCICLPGYTTNSTGSCVPELNSDTKSAYPGAPCMSGSSPCEGGSWCNDGNCLCPISTVNKGNARCSNNDTTSPLQVLGQPCNYQTDCSKNLQYSTCINYRCQCESNYVASNGICVSQSNGIKRCSSYRDCESPRVCSSSGNCECPFTMTESSTGVCVYKNNDVSAPVGSWCDDNAVKCQLPAICTNSLCKCPSDYYDQNSVCISKKYAQPTSTCSSGRMCPTGSNCTNGMCMCLNGVESDGKTCKLISKRDTEQLATPSKELLTACPTDGSCKLPDCFCSESGTVPPGNLQPRDVPQMVILTFTDAITDRIINIYKTLFSGRFQNPNECAIKGTFFISHEFNNYDQTQWLYSRGNEIALNSITQENLMNATKERWYHEMVGIRESLRTFSYVEESSMKGIRAPHLLMGGDAQFSMMKENQFLYDNSMVVRDGPVWPQTLDHKLSWDCGNQNCPTVPFKGIWELPLQLLADNRGTYHPLAKNAIKPNDRQDNIQQMLLRNFYRNYNGNRAPFVLTADSDFLTYQSDNGVLHALEYFLEHILNKTDVYVVTASQAIQWMRKPTSLSNIKKFKPWHCNFRMNDHIQPCENPSTCSYHANNPAGRSHSFRVCGSCPKYYPWIEDPLGRKKFYRK